MYQPVSFYKRKIKHSKINIVHSKASHYTKYISTSKFQQHRIHFCVSICASGS